MVSRISLARMSMSAALLPVMGVLRIQKIANTGPSRTIGLFLGLLLISDP